MRKLYSFLPLLLLILLLGPFLGTNPESDIRFVTAKSGLILRSGPSLKSPKILTIPFGAQVFLAGDSGHERILVEGIEGKMVGIRYKEKKGYAFEGFLSRWPIDKEKLIAVFNWEKDRWGFELVGGNKMIILPQYDMASDFFAGVAAVVDTLNQETFLINKKNEKIKKLDENMTWGHWEPSGEDFPNGFSDGRLLVSNRNYELEEVEGPERFGFVDLSGKLVIPMIYANAQTFVHELALVNTGGDSEDYRWQMGGKWGFINPEGKMVIAADYDYAYGFSEGRAAVLNNELWGYIDMEGNVVISHQYEEQGSFSEGLAWVKDGEYFKAIGRNGKTVIQGKFYDATAFSRGTAFVEKANDEEDGTTCYEIDKKGRLIKKIDCEMAFGGC